jgi:hypothetical protein
MAEPNITINGQQLSEAEAMTVRVAVASFAMSLTDEGLGDDDHGKKMTAAYLARLQEIQAKIFAPTGESDRG